MSFLDQYVKKHRLQKMSDKHKKNIEKIEQHLEKITKDANGEMTFEDCIKRFGPHISDLVERVSNYISEFDNWSLSNVMNMFRFVHSIAIEVYQIVEQMADCVIDDNMTEKQKHDAKVAFGQELVYFVWKIVDPLRGRFDWIPFKQIIEKKLVMWLAGMALESIVDLFHAADLGQISTMSADNKSIIIRAL